MECTQKQLYNIFDDTITYYSKLGSMKQRVNRADIVTTDNRLITVRLNDGTTLNTDCNCSYSLFYTDIIVNENNKDMLLHRLYRLSNNYYTTDYNYACKASNLRLNRYLNKQLHNTLYCFINTKKLSAKVINYFNNKICNLLDNSNRTHNFKINDICVSYRGINRKVSVNIKHIDNICSETYYL